MTSKLKRRRRYVSKRVESGNIWVKCKTSSKNILIVRLVYNTQKEFSSPFILTILMKKRESLDTILKPYHLESCNKLTSTSKFGYTLIGYIIADRSSLERAQYHILELGLRADHFATLLILAETKEEKRKPVKN